MLDGEVPLPVAQPHVLIVDDNRDLAENLVEVLEDEGFACAIAHGGDEAIAEIERAEFDLVITDFRMAPVDGLAVVGAVRRKSLQTPVVMMTAFAVELQLDAARIAGVTEIVAKPVDTGRLVAFARRCVAQP